MIFIALTFGLFVFFKDKKSLRSTLLLLIAVFFVGATLNNIFEWASNDALAQMLSWQLTATFELPISLLSIYFMYVFFEGEDLPDKLKYVLAALFLPVIFLLPTVLNIQKFYLTTEDCGGVLGPLWMFIYSFEVFAVFVVAYIGLRKYFRIREDRTQSLQTIMLTIGSVIFLSLFSLSNIYGELTKIYQINLIGPIGLLLFIVLLAYSIVKYKAFDIKLIGAQALIVSLVVLIGSEFFFIQSDVNRILTAITLVITGVIGLNLIRSVKKEVEQREHIEKLAGELQLTNERQETLIHFIGHEVKGFLTKAAGAFASLSEDDFAPLPEALKPFVEAALAETRGGVDSVSTILKAANLKKGTVAYDKKPFDLKALVSDAVEKAKSTAELKNLTLSFTADEGSYQMTGDKAQINDHVLRNLIDNSINYTPSGSITVSLKRQGTRIIFAVKDTGVGITEEDKKRLFTEGGHGKDSQTINVHSTGYGLYIAKQITEAHGGTIRAESEGTGKGSAFIVEFPVS